MALRGRFVARTALFSMSGSSPRGPGRVIPRSARERAVSQEVESPASATEPVSPPRAASATRRVRARLARRITAQRPAQVKQVLEPLAAVHRELHPQADLALLQRAYDIAEVMHR